MRTKTLIVLALSPLLAACTASTTAWDAPTRVRFGTISTENARAVEQVFAKHDLGVKTISTSPNAYDVYGLRNAAQVADLKHDLDNIFESQGVSVPLDFAMLSYASTDKGSAQARATIDLSVAPGARLFIADQTHQSPWREVVPTPSGHWRGTVQTNGIVAYTGGSLYVAARNADNFTRYFKVDAGKNSGGLAPVSYVAIHDAGLNEPLTQPASLMRSTIVTNSNPSMPKHLAQIHQQQQQYLRLRQTQPSKFAAKPSKMPNTLKHVQTETQTQADESGFR